MQYSSDLQLIDLPSAKLLQILLLCVRHFRSVNYVVCRGKIYILKLAIQLVPSQYYILRISYDEPASLAHRNIHNASYPF